MCMHVYANIMPLILLTLSYFIKSIKSSTNVKLANVDHIWIFQAPISSSAYDSCAIRSSYHRSCKAGYEGHFLYLRVGYLYMHAYKHTPFSWLMLWQMILKPRRKMYQDGPVYFLLLLSVSFSPHFVSFPHWKMGNIKQIWAHTNTYKWENSWAKQIKLKYFQEIMSTKLNNWNSKNWLTD